jgi:hypothetical protein
MLPTTLGAADGGGGGHQAGGSVRSRAAKSHAYFSTYFRRIVKPRQMDFECVVASPRRAGCVCLGPC